MHYSFQFSGKDKRRMKTIGVQMNGWLTPFSGGIDDSLSESKLTRSLCQDPERQTLCASTGSRARHGACPL